MKDKRFSLRSVVNVINWRRHFQLAAQECQVAEEALWATELEKPCSTLGWCPYGKTFASKFPSSIGEARDLGLPVENMPVSCRAWTDQSPHCPVFYLAESHADFCAGKMSLGDCEGCLAGPTDCPRGEDWQRRVNGRGMLSGLEHAAAGGLDEAKCLIDAALAIGGEPG